VSNAPVQPNYRRKLDLSLVLAGVVLLIWGHFVVASPRPGSHEPSSDPLPFALAVPALYVLLATLWARAGLAAAGRRGYVLSCLGGLCGVGYVAMAAVGELGMSLPATPTGSSGGDAGQAAGGDLTAGANLVLGLLSDTATHFLYPIITGIAIYAVCSVFEADETSAVAMAPGNSSSAAKIDFGRLAEWLEASDAPHAVRLFLEELGERVTELSGAYRQMAESARDASEEVRTTATATGELHAAFKQIAASGSSFASDMQQASEGLTDFRQELGAANDESERLTDAVGQIRQVVDELAELASHEILNMGSGARGTGA